METARYFARLFDEAFPLEFAGLLLIPLVIFAATWLAFSRERLGRVDLIRALPLLLLPLVLLLWGTYREHSSAHWDRTVRNWRPWETYVLDGLAGGSVVILGIVVWRSRGRRVVMFAWCLFVMCWLFMAWFVSAMSITGDWL